MTARVEGYRKEAEAETETVPYPIEDKLVIAIASSALFDLSESDRVYH
jgi:hypothetical protein